MSKILLVKSNSISLSHKQGPFFSAYIEEYGPRGSTFVNAELISLQELAKKVYKYRQEKPNDFEITTIVRRKIMDETDSLLQYQLPLSDDDLDLFWAAYQKCR